MPPIPPVRVAELTDSECEEVGRGLEPQAKKRVRRSGTFSSCNADLDLKALRQQLSKRCACSQQSKSRRWRGTCLAPFLRGHMWDKFMSFRKEWRSKSKLDQDTQDPLY